MTEEAFIEIITSLQGIPDVAKTKLIAIAGEIDDTKRADILNRLMPLNAELQDACEKMLASGEEGKAILWSIRKEAIPKMHADIEKAESDEEIGNIESSLDSL